MHRRSCSSVQRPTEPHSALGQDGPERSLIAAVPWRTRASGRATSGGRAVRAARPAASVTSGRAPSRRRSSAGAHRALGRGASTARRIAAATGSGPGARSGGLRRSRSTASVAHRSVSTRADSPSAPRAAASKPVAIAPDPIRMTRRRTGRPRAGARRRAPRRRAWRRSADRPPEWSPRRKPRNGGR